MTKKKRLGPGANVLTAQRDDTLPEGAGATANHNPATEDKAAVAMREVLVTERETLAHLRETATDTRETMVHVRENSATSREQNAHLRENAVYRREHLAVEREGEICTEQAAHSASAEFVAMLKEANQHLVIATLEANAMAEEVEMAKVKLDHLAHHDLLTNLPNRMLFHDRLIQAIERAQRRAGSFALLFLDLDRFKNINDSLGHAVGDQLLQIVAHSLISCVRRSDTVSRHGGDEFLVLLADIEHAEDAAIAAQKILVSLALPNQIERHDIDIGASIGISVYPSDGVDAEMLIKHADTAMYYAKQNGGNNFRFFEREMNARAMARQSTETGLRRALERHEFVLHYQPKVDLRSDTIIGVEALIRWRHPDFGMMQPAQFIGIAEECGLILPIGRWVLQAACLQAQAWRQAGLAPLTMAVNTSAVEFRADDFLANIRAILETTSMDPRYLELELTEGVLIQDAAGSDSTLNAVAAMGIQLSLDDFGTGYSSLSYLSRFPINTLKIDQSFVKQMSASTDDATIVSAVISLGKNLRKRVIAEGVETQEQHAFLLAKHCDEGQGFYYAPPVEADVLATMLRSGGWHIPRSA